MPDPNVDIPGCPGEVNEMPATASEQFMTLNERAMLNQASVFEAQQNRATAGDAAVAELVRNGFGAVSVNSIQLVGAKAAQTLEADRIAQQILAERAVRNQPAPTAGGPADTVAS